MLISNIVDVLTSGSNFHYLCPNESVFFLNPTLTSDAIKFQFSTLCLILTSGWNLYHSCHFYGLNPDRNIEHKFSGHNRVQKV